LKEHGGKRKNPMIWSRFRNANTDSLIGDTSLATDVSEEEMSWRTPTALTDSKAIFELSFNNLDWQQVLAPGQNYSYQYYNAPKITAVSPQYGQVKSPNKEFIDISGKNFQCMEPECKDLFVRFGEGVNSIYVKAERISDEKIRAPVPKYSKPDVLTVEATFNGADYTHDNQTYGFFDPYVFDVQPRLISTKGSTRVRLIGFGFVNAGDDLKSQFSSATRGQL
jgi:hypothetical protein